MWEEYDIWVEKQWNAVIEKYVYILEKIKNIL